MSEAVVQAEFYMAAQQIGLRCTLELTTHHGRLDIMIFNEDWTRILAIVECKNLPHVKMHGTRQIERYKRLGVSVYGLSKVDRAVHLATVIKNSNHVGIPVESVPINRFVKKTKLVTYDASSHDTATIDALTQLRKSYRKRIKSNGSSHENKVEQLARELDEDVNFRKYS